MRLLPDWFGTRAGDGVLGLGRLDTRGDVEGDEKVVEGRHVIALGGVGALPLDDDGLGAGRRGRGAGAHSNRGATGAWNRTKGGRAAARSVSGSDRVLPECCRLQDLNPECPLPVSVTAFVN